MPIVDKLPSLLREDLESAFTDDLDNVFDISNVKHSLGQQKQDTEIELRRVGIPFSSFSFREVLLILAWSLSF